MGIYAFVCVGVCICMCVCFMRVCASECLCVVRTVYGDVYTCLNTNLKRDCKYVSTNIKPLQKKKKGHLEDYSKQTTKSENSKLHNAS